MARPAPPAGSRRSAAVLVDRFLAGYLDGRAGTATSSGDAVFAAAPATPWTGGPEAVGDAAGLRRVVVDDDPPTVRALAAAGADVMRGTLGARLPEVVSRAEGMPLLLAFDVASAGLPYEDLVALLAATRPGRWPATDVLVLFRADAVRRAAASPARGSGAAAARLDAALGSTAWRTHLERGGVTAVVDDHAGRLDAAVPGAVWPAAVRLRAATDPVFWLVLVTRQPGAGWRFSDAVARARRAWRRALRVPDATAEPPRIVDDALDGALFDARHLRSDAERQEERAVVEALKANLLTTRERLGEFRIADRPREVLDGVLGTADTAQLRAAVRELHAGGRTLSSGVGGDIREHVLRRPPRGGRR